VDLTHEEAHRLAREKGINPVAYFVARLILVPVLRIFFGLQAKGVENIPKKGPVVIAPNHKSFWDSFFIAAATKRHLRFMGKSELFTGRRGRLIAGLGAFPVRRGEGDRDSLRLAREIAREGHMVGVFVEGTRQKLGYPGEVLPGAMMIALQEGVPIVPCGVYSFGWSRKNRMLCAVVWGEPMDLGSMPKSGRGYRRAAELVGDELRHLWRQAGEAIAAGLPETLPDGARRSGPVYPSFRTVAATPSSSTSVKNAFANGDASVRARTVSQSICSRSARAASSTLEKSGSCSVIAMSFDTITSSSVDTLMRSAITSETGARSMISPVIGPLAGLKMRSTSAPFSCHVL